MSPLYTQVQCNCFDFGQSLYIRDNSHSVTFFIYNLHSIFIIIIYPPPPGHKFVNLFIYIPQYHCKFPCGQIGVNVVPIELLIADRLLRSNESIECVNMSSSGEAMAALAKRAL